MQCPLCHDDQAALHHQDDSRAYYQCAVCSLIFVPQEFHLPPEEEKKRYDHHQNKPEDPRYREFLSKLVKPLVPRLPQNAEGLDFGAGPGPTLSYMFAELGFAMRNWDPFYANDPDALNAAYDFITCSETAEHFCSPRKDFERMLDMIRAGGILGIMTDRYDGKDNFADWHYTRDDTHVNFYSEKTFSWLADNFNLDVDFPGDSVALLKKRRR